MTAPAAGEEMKRAIAVAFVGLGGILELGALRSRPWASITFSGERHVLDLRLRGPGARAAMDIFLTGLTEREFALRGHVLVDIAACERVDEADMVHLTLEALTVAEN